MLIDLPSDREHTETFVKIDDAILWPRILKQNLRPPSITETLVAPGHKVDTTQSFKEVMRNSNLRLGLSACTSQQLNLGISLPWNLSARPFRLLFHFIGKRINETPHLASFTISYNLLCTNWSVLRSWSQGVDEMLASRDMYCFPVLMNWIMGAQYFKTKVTTIATLYGSLS